MTYISVMLTLGVGALWCIWLALVVAGAALDRIHAALLEILRQRRGA